MNTTPTKPQSPFHKRSQIRLHKILAQNGYGSRRHLESLIKQGRLTVNHHLAHIGQTINPKLDQIALDGKIILFHQPTLYYYLVNKPPGFVTSRLHQDSTPLVTDLVDTPIPLYPVGRLDKDSQGLLLMTNDGQLTFRLTHPRYHVTKTYVVTVSGRFTSAKRSLLETGLFLDGKKTAPCQVNVLSTMKKSTTLNWVLYEGKNRQIRRMAAAVDLTVTSLTRTQIGPLALGRLNLGRSRPLTPVEIKLLKTSVGL